MVCMPVESATGPPRGGRDVCFIRRTHAFRLSPSWTPPPYSAAAAAASLKETPPTPPLVAGRLTLVDTSTDWSSHRPGGCAGAPKAAAAMVLRMSCTAASEAPRETLDDACAIPAAAIAWITLDPAAFPSCVPPSPPAIFIRDLAVSPISADGLDIGRMLPGALCGLGCSHLELVASFSLGDSAVLSYPSPAAAPAAEEETTSPPANALEVSSNERLGYAGPVPDRYIRPPAAVRLLDLRGD